ncbi:hypothetical protein G7046_g7560 [Stylonectria norvegica]|nr:hypothetical protein G7046_g7560 [Stylonectria norvegica]
MPAELECLPEVSRANGVRHLPDTSGAGCNCTSDVPANSKDSSQQSATQALYFQLNQHLWPSRQILSTHQNANLRCSSNVSADASHAATGSREYQLMPSGRGDGRADSDVLQKEDQAGHTISQRLRKLKQVPPELFPLAVVVGFALAAAAYSCSRKFIVDKNLRLARQGAAGRADH